MTPLTRWYPFKPLGRFDALPEIDDIFRNFGLRPVRREADEPLAMRLSVTDKDAAYEVAVDLPGVDKDKIDVSIDDNQVSIQADVEREIHKGAGAELYSERYSGRAVRSFSLPQAVDPATAKAKYENGVLTLTLPKKPNGRSQKIAVQ